ncbi:MAG: signal peptidase I, partial [Micrococcales bacterium]
MFKEAGIVLGTALVLSLLIKTFLAQAFYIPSGSMENTLAVGDRVMVSLLTPGPFDLERGDVVVFKDPGEWLTGVEEPERGTVSQAMVDAFTFIGVLPQDAGQHLIKRVIGLPGDDVACCDADGRITVNGAAIDESGYVREGARPSADPFDVKVPEGRLWVMGDNRANSDDSRAHYVATQDEEYSTVPISNVVGRAVFVFYP